MPPQRPDIKVLIAAGSHPRDAIKSALGCTFSDFAERHGFVPSAVSMCVHGHQRHEKVRKALAEELNVGREWLDSILDGQVEEAEAEKGAA